MDSSEIHINDLVSLIIERKNPLVSERLNEVENEDFEQEQQERILRGGKTFHKDTLKNQHKSVYQALHGHKFSSKSSKCEKTSPLFRTKTESPFKMKPDIHGNSAKGSQWIKGQKRRHEIQMYNAQEKKKIQSENLECDKITYLEPSSAQNRLNYLRKLRRPFEDIDFPPKKKSLLVDNSQDMIWQKIKWRKICHFLPQSQIFSRRPEPMDIKQGFLGDCYFLAGLAALAEHPHRIFDLFLLKDKNQLNYYSVKILFRGKWKIINLDDSIPFFNSEPAFSKLVSKDLWVIILEKAWAKIYGSYQAIEAGFPEEPLHDLTGAPVHHLHLQHRSFNRDREWKYLLKASKLEYSMIASSRERLTSTTQSSSNGIVHGFPYTFLNATYINWGGELKKIVQLRNPWGNAEFTGKWSIYDPQWQYISEEQKERLDLNPNKKDGKFYMSYDDFLLKFKTLSIAEINDNASYIYRSYYDPLSKGVYFRVQIKKSGLYSFQVDNTPQRSLEKQLQARYTYPEIWLQLGKLQSTYTKKFQGKRIHRRALFKKYELTPGTYISWVRISFDRKVEEDFEVNLAIYSEYACEINIAQKIEAIKFRGDINVDWKGEGQFRGKKISSHIHQSVPSYQHNKCKSNIKQDEKINQTDHNSSSEKNSDLVPYTPNILVAPDEKKIRKIKITTQQQSTLQEYPNGAVKVTSVITQKKQEVLGGKSGVGDDIVLMIQDSEKKTDILQNQFNGETLKKTESYKEVITTQQRDFDGVVIDRREEKQGQLQTLAEEDETQMKQEIQQQNSNITSPAVNRNRFASEDEMDSEQERKAREKMNKATFGNGNNKYTVLIEPSESASQSGY